MEITAYFNLLSSVAATGSTAGGSGTSASAPSIFGPATLVSLGQTTGETTGYSNLSGTSSANGASLWQFDLASVLSPASAGITEAPRSPAQQKAEQAAIKQALADINAGSYDDARTLMNDLLAKNKTNAAAISVLGTIEQAAGQYKKAEQLFLKAHALNSAVGYDKDAENARTLQKDDAAVLARARAMVATSDRRDDGVRLLIALTDRSPDNTDAHLLFGEALLKENDAANGLMQYNTAIRTADREQLGQIEARLTTLARSQPKSAFVQQLIGRVQLRQGRNEDAVQTLTHAADLLGDQSGDSTDLANAYVGLGREQLNSGDLNVALANFALAESLAPGDRNVKTAVAEGYLAQAEKLGRQLQYKAALDGYRKVAGLLGTASNNDLRTRAAHGAFAVGQTLEQKRVAAGADIDQEAVAYQIAYDLTPDSTTYKHKLAETRNALGDQLLADSKYKEAASSYALAYGLDKNNATYKSNTINAWVAYGDYRGANLNYTDAVNAYKEAYALDATNLSSRQKLADAYTTRGLDFKSRDEMRLAVADFKEALRLFPDNHTYQDNYNALKGWDT